ncbi:ankyrin repeat domain-containing protein 54 [Agrilus planipennis]|uniref:Ankyrin repeat domain-containing protein 54 n=1 Tax=Agrilus planipennis TaxID=224129 RepID=A0A1W4XWF3_AGRPL|nr:ankyrin repeat domain-containing protein 54 [Agrilus planipennis]
MSSHSDSELKEYPYTELTQTRFDFKAKAKRKFSGNSSLKSFKKYYVKKSKSLSINQRRLLTAAQTNNTEMVQKLLELDVDPNTADIQCRSALHWAVSRDYSDVVRLLLDHGADPNQQDIVGNTPLHLAACTSNLRIITTLLNAGANVRSLDMEGRNPLQLAESKLQILRHSWRSGTIEMIQLRTQLQQIIDIMISLWKHKEAVKWGHHRENVDDLELMKHSIKYGEEVDDQMTKLLTELQEFKI